MNNRNRKFNFHKLSFKLSFYSLLSLLAMTAGMNYYSIERQTKLINYTFEQQTKSCSALFLTLLDCVDTGDYTAKDGSVYKGDIQLDSLKSEVTKATNNSEVSLALYVENNLAVSSSNMDLTPYLDKIYPKLKEKGDFWEKDLVVDGKSLFCYFTPITAPNSSDIIGFICADTETTKSQQMITSFRNKAMVVSTTSIVIIYIITILVLRSLTKELNHITSCLNQVAEGILTVEINPKYMKSKDEIGEMSCALSKVILALKNILAQIQTSALEIKNFSSNFSQSFIEVQEDIGHAETSIEAIAQNATFQANEIQRANADINTISRNIDSTSSNADSLEKTSNVMKEYSTNAKSVLDDLITINEKTASSFEDVKKMSSATNRSVNDISSTLDNITDIAFQTNLLSLNASIEAARAGDAGKGFGIVADEIRKLAEQSSDMVDKIHTILDELTRNSTQSVQLIDNASHDVMSQNDKLMVTTQFFQKLLNEVGKIFSDITSIKEQMVQLEHMKTALVDKTENLSSISEENAANTEETSASVINLNTILSTCNEQTDNLVILANNLNEILKLFTL